MKTVLKKMCLFGLAIILCLPFAACGDPEDGGEPEKQYREVLTDPTFAAGLAVSQLQSQNTATTWWKYCGTADSSIPPYWFLGQYCDLSATRYRMAGDTVAWRYDSTRNDLSLGTIFEDGYGIESEDSGVYSLTNISGSKTVSVTPSTGEINLNIDTSKEYIGEDGSIQKRGNGEDWAHMVLQQAAGGINISQSESIMVTIEFTLPEVEIYDSTVGASQFQWIFSVKDYASPVNDYYWFNITLFDDRYQDVLFSGTQMFDGGKSDATGRFIYAPKGGEYLNEPVTAGKTYRISKDFRPYFIDAFEKAKERGALAQSSLENMGLNSMNIGWEVSNVAKVALKITELSLKVR